MRDYHSCTYEGKPHSGDCLGESHTQSVILYFSGCTIPIPLILNLLDRLIDGTDFCASTLKETFALLFKIVYRLILCSLTCVKEYSVVL